MKDIIDLGNLVFNQLVKSHGELEESRTLFLYGITVGSDWQVLGSVKVVIIDQTGVSINFEDQIITDVNSQWKQIITNRQGVKAAAELSKIKSNTKQFKDGETYEFWQNEGPWKEINF